MHLFSASPHGRCRLLGAAILLVSLLIAGNLCLIFGFSGESREESGARSRRVTEIVARVVYARFEDRSEMAQEQIVERLHGFVRKAAHFTEFGLLGWLTTILAKLGELALNRRQVLWQTVGASAGFCLLTAIADETYQIFTNRGASPVDVCIDFCGALCGILLLHGAVWLWTALRRPRPARKEGVSP